MKNCYIHFDQPELEYLLLVTMPTAKWNSSALKGRVGWSLAFTDSSSSTIELRNGFRLRPKTAKKGLTQVELLSVE